jgi:predicted dehydrogenase/threonine dehydrogenase-like Zn-dependent dehydrogenase
VKQVFLKKGQVKLYNIDIPLLDQNSILVTVDYSFISSGTEFATVAASGKSLFEKTYSNFNQNIQKITSAIKDNGLAATFALIREKLDTVMPLGYSCSGKVVAVGKNVDGFFVGDYVACAGSGHANHADVVVVPKNFAIKIKNQEMLKQCSLTTIGAIALQGVRRANLELGQKVCVIGLGLIGQLTVQLAKLSGCQVYGIDVQENRLELAKNLGADFVFNPANCDIIKELDWTTSQHGVDKTIITASGKNGQIIQQAMQITRRKGKVVLVGDVKIDFDRDPFYSKEIDFLISCSYGPGRYDDAYEKRGVDYPYDYVRWTENRNMELFAKLVQEQKILIDPLISNEFDLSNVEAAYQSLQNRSGLGIILSYKAAREEAENGLILRYDLLRKSLRMSGSECNGMLPARGPFDKLRTSGEPSPLGRRADVQTPPNTTKKFISSSITTLGVIGVGGFCKIKLLPAISKIKNVQIQAMVDANPTTLINISGQYKVQNTGNDYKKLLDNNSINTIIVATPHGLHTDQAIDCMSAGKAVFVEKPAAVNSEQLEKLSTFLTQNPDAFYCVDFNRSFSPFIKKIKEAVRSRNNPMIIHYRMNAGLIPKDHWLYSPANGGRIIGEACHIFDLFCFLTDAQPISISVESINSDNDAVKSADNFTAQIRMSDGSCCSLTYTSVGNSESGKERMEIFFDGKSIVMNDYLQLQGFGLPKSFDQSSKTQDKGHEALLQEFFTAAQTANSQPPIPYQRILMTTKISLIIDELVKSGGGSR